MKAASDFEHGTADGYREHRRRGEYSCGLCRDAFSVEYFEVVRARAFQHGWDEGCFAEQTEAAMREMDGG